MSEVNVDRGLILPRNPITGHTQHFENVHGFIVLPIKHSKTHGNTNPHLAKLPIPRPAAASQRRQARDP